MLKIIYDRTIPYLETYLSKLPCDLIPAFPEDFSNKDKYRYVDVVVIRTNIKINKAFLCDTSVATVCTASVGLDHVDLEYCAQNGIKVFHAKSANTMAVADYVVTAFFSVIVKSPKNNYSVGIIGLGNIGKLVYRRFMSLNCRCCAYDPFEASNDSPMNNYRFVSFSDALNCDIITFHVPLTIAGNFPTYRMLNEKNVYEIRAGSIVINSSRGGVIDENAILQRMREKNDLTLVIDVWENEPSVNKELVSYSKISTPHIAGWSASGRNNIARMLRDQLVHHLSLPKALNDYSIPPVTINLDFNHLNDIQPSDLIMFICITQLKLSATSHALRQMILTLELPNAKVFKTIQSQYENRVQLSDITLTVASTLSSKSLELFSFFSIKTRNSHQESLSATIASPVKSNSKL